MSESKRKSREGKCINLASHGMCLTLSLVSLSVEEKFIFASNRHQPATKLRFYSMRVAAKGNFSKKKQFLAFIYKNKATARWNGTELACMAHTHIAS